MKIAANRNYKNIKIAKDVSGMPDTTELQQMIRDEMQKQIQSLQERVYALEQTLNAQRRSDPDSLQAAARAAGSAMGTGEQADLNAQRATGQPASARRQ